jgi:polysaccharide pyruvyl transferase WcaK-like protein
MSYRNAASFRSRAGRLSSNPLIRLARRLFIRVPLELLDWLKAFRALKGTHKLMMVGTGMLGDFGIGPFDLHYEILKWSIIAKMRRCKLLFVSVGAGPIDHPLSRRIVKCAISLADYRSYRDTFSQQYLDSIGFNASRDRVYPDLAFSLLRAEMPVSKSRARNGRIVGLGLMEYYGKDYNPERSQRIYQDYIEGVTHFAAWLLRHGYSLRLLIGDVTYDKGVRSDVLRLLQEQGVRFDPGQIIDEPVASVEQLCVQLTQTDMVVATRFHNILLALMLNKPVVALSYHEKVRSLMADMGLAEYCQDIAGLDIEKLIRQFINLQENADAIRSSIKRKADEYRMALDEQYGHICNSL